MPRIVSKRRLGVVLVFTRNTRLLPSVCVYTQDPERWTVHALSLLIPPSLVFAISHILVMRYVQCKPLLLWHSHVKMWTHYKRLKPWRMYFMLLGVSQLMLHTSHSASCKVHVTHVVLFRLGVGWEKVWLAHLYRLAGRRTREECTQTQNQGGGFECCCLQPRRLKMIVSVSLDFRSLWYTFQILLLFQSKQLS